MVGRRQPALWPARLAVLGVLSAVMLAVACGPPAAPTLDIVQPASNAPTALDTAVELRVAHATLDGLVLERLDQPGAPVPALVRTATGASLQGRLEPDARYRLVAQAKALPPSFQAPWDGTPPATVEREQIFSTVRTPRLDRGTEPVLLGRDEPLLLRFTEPLAALQADAEVPAVAEIDRADARKVWVRLVEPPPGEDFTVQVYDIVGQQGAVRAPNLTVAVRTPAPPEALAVSGTPMDDTVTVPAGAALALDWNLPIKSMRYRLGDSEAVWTGAPATRVELPGTLAQGETRPLALLDAETAEGGWLRAARTIDLAAPGALRLAAYWPANGAVGVVPHADPTFRFTEPIVDRAAAEAAIVMSPSVPGRFEWLANNRVRFVPDGTFPRETPIRVEVKAGPTAARGQSGSFMVEPVSFSFQTGKLKVIDVSLSAQRMVLLEDGVQVWSAPVATGVKGAETPPGTYEVQYKMPIARFRGTNPGGSRYDIPDVKWVIAFLGDYTIHGAYWRTAFGRPASNGCISLTDANAKHVYDWADVGTTIVIRS